MKICRANILSDRLKPHTFAFRNFAACFTSTGLLKPQRHCPPHHASRLLFTRIYISSRHIQLKRDVLRGDQNLSKTGFPPRVSFPPHILSFGILMEHRQSCSHIGHASSSELCVCSRVRPYDLQGSRTDHEHRVADRCCPQVRHLFPRWYSLPSLSNSVLTI